MKRESSAAKRTLDLPGVSRAEQADRNAPEMPPEYRKIVIRNAYAPGSTRGIWTTHYAERGSDQAVCGALGQPEKNEPVTDLVCQECRIEAARRFARGR